MPTIIAICPYCRAGGVRAPDTSIGASAVCPKCKSNFTVLPSDDIPEGWDKPAASKAAPKVAPQFAPPSAPASSPLDETQATAAMPDVTEPSPVLPPDPPAKPQATAPPSSEAPDTETAPTAPPGSGMVLALGALCLVGPAMVATLLPYGRVIALVLAGVGFVAALLSLGSEGRARLAGACAAALHFVAVIVLLFLPSWLGLDPWSGATAPEGPKGPVVIENSNGAVASVSVTDVIDGARYSWQNGGVRVSVRSGVGPLELLGPNGAKRTTKEQYLHLNLRVRNTGYEKELPLSGWAAGQGTDGVRVTDANGKPLVPATFDANWTAPRTAPLSRAMPGHTVETVLYFAAPLAKTDFVRVEVTTTAVGAPGEIKFRTGTAPLQPAQPGPPPPPQPGQPPQPPQPPVPQPKP